MKKNLFVLIVISFIVVTTSAQQANNQKNNPVGTWKFEAPYAPEGYTSGTIIVGLEDQKHTTSMAFAGSEYKLPGENVKAVNDSILFSIYMEGQDIKVMLKIENETKMSGKAVYSEGEVPLTLTKVVTVEPDVK